MIPIQQRLSTWLRLKGPNLTGDYSPPVHLVCTPWSVAQDRSGCYARWGSRVLFQGSSSICWPWWTIQGPCTRIESEDSLTYCVSKRRLGEVVPSQDPDPLLTHECIVDVLHAVAPFHPRLVIGCLVRSTSVRPWLLKQDLDCVCIAACSCLQAARPTSPTSTP